MKMNLLRTLMVLTWTICLVGCANDRDKQFAFNELDELTSKMMGDEPYEGQSDYIDYLKDNGYMFDGPKGSSYYFTKISGEPDIPRDKIRLDHSGAAFEFSTHDLELAQRILRQSEDVGFKHRLERSWSDYTDHAYLSHARQYRIYYKEPNDNSREQSEPFEFRFEIARNGSYNTNWWPQLKEL